MSAAQAVRPGRYRDLSAHEVAAERGRARFIDVREPDEFTGELGHIAGSELVPLGGLERAARGWSHDQRLVIVCRSGARSGRAASHLVAVGFRDVINLAGGMIGWNQAGLPIER